jgi:4a-hydroxytetrahydrobiopterin dehydratase
MNKLANMKLKKLSTMTSLMSETDIADWLKKLGNGWKIVKQNMLEKDYLFDDFKHALEFVNAVGKVSERYKHHPDIYISYDEVKLIMWTHSIAGLTVKDFIMSAKFDEAYDMLPKPKKRNKIVEL